MVASPVGVPVALVVVGAPARPGWGTTLGRFIRPKPLGAAGGAITAIMLVTAVLAPWLQTHDPIATDATYTLGRPKDRKSTRLNSSHGYISYAVFCLKKKKKKNRTIAQYKNITAEI